MGEWFAQGRRRDTTALRNGILVLRRTGYALLPVGESNKYDNNNSLPLLLHLILIIFFVNTGLSFFRKMQLKHFGPHLMEKA